MVDVRAGPSLKTTLKPKKVKTLSGNRIKSNQISKLQKEFKRHNSDAHSTTSSASPAQSPCYSNQSDDGSDTEMASGSNRTPVFSFLDLTYWKRQKICCGIIYKGRFGEVLIDRHLFKPCYSNKKAAAKKPEEQGPEPLPISTQEWWLRFLCRRGTKKKHLNFEKTTKQQTDPLFCLFVFFEMESCSCCLGWSAVAWS